nr:prohibitin family protein [Anaerolineae bacterium]
MAIKAVLGFFIAVFVLLIIAGIGLAVINAQRGRRVRPGIILAIIGALGTMIIAPLNAGLVLVQPNEVGVVFRQTASGDSALLEPLQPGLSWVIPFVDQVIIYDAGQQSVTMATLEDGGTAGLGQGPVRAISSDGQVIIVDITIIYRINPAEVNDIFRSWRGGFQDTFIIPQVRSEVRNAVSEYGAEQIYGGGRAALEAQAAQALRAKFEREGFVLTDFLVRDITFTAEFADAIEQKQIAEQEAQRAAFLVQQAEQEAEQARVEAQGRADSAVIEAEGEALAIVLRAEADAEALDLINQILSENSDLLQWQYITELGDNVRIILLPSNSPYLFDFQSLIEETQEVPASTPADSSESSSSSSEDTP